MLMTLFLLLIFIAVGAGLWFQGLWSVAITLINLLLAMLIATNLWEPICSLVESLGGGSLTYLLDFVVLWILFGVTFSILRGITDLLSRKRVQFILPVEMAGRSILSIWCAWLVVCFTAFTLHTAPLASENPLGAWSTPESKVFFGLGPDRMWLGLVQMTSRGAFSRGAFSGNTNPADANLNVETFDPNGDFLIRYHDRRAKFANPDLPLSVPR
ncbi:MAG: hypothetical protein SFU86_24310 [Pirellulaceae bacterium]|nr:hypothetical protein [Pirellulaceae bacterium]